jgi:hypothetical protein
MKYKNNEGLEYLKHYPHLWKWMNKCSGCGQIGYKPDLPEHIHPEHAVPHLRWNDEYIRKYFKPLYVNENDYCEICEKIFDHKN